MNRNFVLLNGKASWLGLVLLLFWMGCSGWTEEEKKRQTFPEFQFEGVMGEVVQRSDFKEGTPVTVVYFDPDCEHCVVTMASIKKNLPAFKGMELMFVSGSIRGKVIPYLGELGFLDQPGIKVGICAPEGFLETFGTLEAPTTLFYGGDFDLKRAYKGPVDSAGVVLGIRYAKGEVKDN